MYAVPLYCTSALYTFSYKASTNQSSVVELYPEAVMLWHPMSRGEVHQCLKKKIEGAPHRIEVLQISEGASRKFRNSMKGLKKDLKVGRWCKQARPRLESTTRFEDLIVKRT